MPEHTRVFLLCACVCVDIYLSVYVHRLCVRESGHVHVCEYVRTNNESSVWEEGCWLLWLWPTTTWLEALVVVMAVAVVVVGENLAVVVVVLAVIGIVAGVVVMSLVVGGSLVTHAPLSSVFWSDLLSVSSNN